jgi:FlaA1/EpsC-like NDP-sugar epimerase
MSRDPNNIESITMQSRPVNTSDPYDPGWVEGRTILVTGGASGFGEGFARKWAENGMFYSVHLALGIR